jgi:hypothetical protein
MRGFAPQVLYFLLTQKKVAKKNGDRIAEYLGDTFGLRGGEIGFTFLFRASAIQANLMALGLASVTVSPPDPLAKSAPETSRHPIVAKSRPFRPS